MKLYRRKPELFYDSRQPKFVGLQNMNEVTYKSTFNRVQNKIFDSYKTRFVERLKSDSEMPLNDETTITSSFRLSFSP